MDSIGTRLRRLRLAKHLKVAETCKEIGITLQAWTDYEKNRTMPQLDKLVRISRFFGVSCDYLIFGRDGEYDPPSVGDDYSSHLQCLVHLLNSGLLQFRKIENKIGDLVFVSSDDYVKIFTLEYVKFMEGNRESFAKGELEKMVAVLTEKYNDKIEVK